MCDTKPKEEKTRTVSGWIEEADRMVTRLAAGQFPDGRMIPRVLNFEERCMVDAIGALRNGVLALAMDVADLKKRLGPLMK